jgi:hypothetical protein
MPKRPPKRDARRYSSSGANSNIGAQAAGQPQARASEGDAVAAKTRQPSTQECAVSQFKALAGPRRLRVQADLEGFPIPGRYGQIEWFDGRDLAVYTNRPRLFAKLWTIPGMRRHQTGVAEMRALFPVEALGQVATVIKARRKRTLVPGEARRPASNLHPERLPSGRSVRA